MKNEMSHTLCYICSHIFEDSRPILLVSKEEGDWQFLCGQFDHDDEVPHVVGANHIFERDEKLLELLSLKDNYEAERADINSKWIIRLCDS